MALFAIISLAAAPSPTALETKINQTFPDAVLKIGEGKWLVVTNITAMEISDKTGISTGQLGFVLVLKVEDYYGFAQSNIWPWIKAKVESLRGS